MSRRKIIIFEKLTLVAWLLGVVARILGYRLFCLSESRIVGKLKVLHLKEILDIKIMPEEPIAYFPVRVGFMRQALACTEDVYKDYCSHNGLIRIFKKRLMTDLIDASYKKILLGRLTAYFQAEYSLEAAVRKYTQEGIIFCPFDFFTVSRWLKKENRLAVKLTPWWARGFSVVLRVVEQLKWIGMFLMFPLVVLSKIRKVVGTFEKRKFQAAIRIYKTDWAFELKYRTIDFLVDGRQLNHTNTLFCVETPIAKSYRQELEKRAYTIADIPEILRVVTGKFLKDVFIKDVMVLWVQCSIHAFFSSPLLIRLTLENLQTYLKWQRFFHEFEIRHYVTYNDRGHQHIIRNIVLAQHGTASWLYAHTCHSNDLFETSSKEKFLDLDFAYLYFDYLVCWGEQLKRYYLSHPNHIKKTLTSGCLWSEHVKMIGEQRNENAIFRKFKSENKKIISVFDTTFWNAVLTSDEMCDFMSGIARLAEDFPNVQIILKRKWTMTDMINCRVPKLEIVYRKFEEQKNCLILDIRDAAEAIAFSDLAISACFTSPTVEALGAYKKGIYFDPQGRFKGSYYGSIPNFLACSYDELKQFVQYWLYEADDITFDDWIKTYIKNEIDYHVDGGAITRFRECLTNGRDH